MLYLNNSLVNLTLIIFSLFFLTFSLADSRDFIFPKKKIITIKSNEKKIVQIQLNKNFELNTLPQKNPLRERLDQQSKVKKTNLTKGKEVKKKIVSNILPVKKSNSKKKNNIKKK